MSKSEKSREEILAERQEKKKRKAALKNQPKDKGPNKENSESKTSKKSSVTDTSVVKNATEISSNFSVTLSNDLEKQSKKKNTVGDGQLAPNKICNSNEVNTGDKVKEVLNDIKKSDRSSDPKTDDLDKNVENKTNLKNENDLDNIDKGATKSKAQLRAERKAKQEADRARKLEKSQAVVQEKKVSKPPAKVAKATTPTVKLSHKVKLFAHLYTVSPCSETFVSSSKIHPKIIELGAQYASKVVTGANARCLALLNTLKKVVMDFETPPNQEFSRGLEAEITKSMDYLSKCRPVAVSMVNAVKHLKFQVSQNKGRELECKNNIIEWIDTYIKEQLEMAAKAICLFVQEKISSGDVILTYGCSSLIQQILISTHNKGINFQVIVADGRPWLEGKEMLRKLVSAGIQCTYVFVNGLSFIMPEVTKILFGAHALLANGYVMSRAGSSQIALLAKTYNVPVLVCCETHKFSERVQTDSFVYNELGNPDDLVCNKGCMSKVLSKWQSIQYITPLNLTYDVTPPDLVTAVVTEIAVLPCTSVPVILRIKPPDVSC